MEAGCRSDVFAGYFPLNEHKCALKGPKVWQADNAEEPDSNSSKEIAVSLL